jgi:hypothetical protein
LPRIRCLIDSADSCGDYLALKYPMTGIGYCARRAPRAATRQSGGARRAARIFEVDEHLSIDVC